jgi:hypothetical protein
VKSATKTLDVFLVQFPLAAENLRDHARGSEYLHQVLLFKLVLLHQKAQNLQGLRARQTIPRFLEVLDQERQEFSKFFLGSGEILAPVELVQDFGISFVLLLGADDFGRNFSKERCIPG